MPNLIAIDEQSRSDHPFLDEDDECYYLREYTPRQGPHYSSTNQLILNLKKSVGRRGQRDYRYKTQAIMQVGDELRAALNRAWLEQATLVPIPCSRIVLDPLYDDRIERVIRRMVTGLDADVRNLVVQTCNLECFHAGTRLPPYDLASYYTLDPNVCNPEPSSIALIDDILTTGSHFKAAKQVLLSEWPSVKVIGVFVARVYRIDDES